MQRRSVQWILLATVLLAATWLRVYDLKNIPAGLFCDEAAFGYNGYALGRSGYDENGRFLPLLIWSFSGYKNTVYMYTTALTTRILGLDEFSTRLPAALYGIGSIWALFALGRALFNPWVGLFAALFMAVAPWHLHFSRIAFEMTPFAFLFTVAALLLVKYTQGKRTLPLAAFFCAACPYNYALSTVFVPLFLIGFAVLYLPTLVRRWKETLLATVVGIGTLTPLVLFYQRNPQGAQYTRNTMWLDLKAEWGPQIDRFVSYYTEFFSQRFLFEHGDPITRHSVREFGELLPIFAPFLIVGIVAALLRRDRFSKLIVWWLAVYPVGAALLTEIPTATRAFIGVPAFCLLAGLGLATALWTLQIVRWRPAVLTLQAAGLAAFGYFLVPQAADYVRFYFDKYPKYSAPTYGGFQYGYRDSIHFMEPLRPQYDLMMITATEVNQPQIFPLFYNAVDPLEYIKTRDIGYLIADPAFYSEYQISRPILYQLRPTDLAYFNDYTVLKEIIAPGGQKEFVIAEVRTRKNFLNRWLGLGLFDNSDNEGMKRDFIDVRSISKDRYQGAFGDIYWRPISQRNVRVDLNAFYAASDPKHPGNPEEVCAYALTTLTSDSAQSAFLEITGSGDPAQVWLNGQLLTPWPLNLAQSSARKEIALGAGNNLLVVKTCEGVGDWYFTARITDKDGKDLPGIGFEAEIPTTVVAAEAAPLPVSDLQLVEGFDRIERYKHTQAAYPDYRGGTESWWAYVNDPEGEVVWYTAPVAAKKPTVAVLTASFSEVAFEGELYVNGKFVLPFQISEARTTQTWANGPYRMTYLHKIDAAGRSGVLFIELPADAVIAGRPVELRITPTKSEHGGWFMVKSYKDTLTHEAITAEQVASLLRGEWEGGDSHQ
jgi:4-amino-4-deoxy-L-arabinose transferase-like glycosyltransferase